MCLVRRRRGSVGCGLSAGAAAGAEPGVACRVAAVFSWQARGAQLKPLQNSVLGQALVSLGVPATTGWGRGSVSEGGCQRGVTVHMRREFVVVEVTLRGSSSEA